jgi:hypothetical protein
LSQINVAEKLFFEGAEANDKEIKKELTELKKICSKNILKSK